MVATEPSALLTVQVYVPRSSALTTRMVRSWKCLSVEEISRRLLPSRGTPSAGGHNLSPFMFCHSYPHPQPSPASHLYSRWPVQQAVPRPGRQVSPIGPGPQCRPQVLEGTTVLEIPDRKTVTFQGTRLQSTA